MVINLGLRYDYFDPNTYYPSDYRNPLNLISNVDTSEVLAAAKTKWNFIDFKTGLVGGHCFGVDPMLVVLNRGTRLLTWLNLHPDLTIKQFLTKR